MSGSCRRSGGDDPRPPPPPFPVCRPRRQGHDHGRRQGASLPTPYPPRALASAAVAHARLGSEGRLRRFRQRHRQGHDHGRRQGASLPTPYPPTRSPPPPSLTLTPAGRVASAAPAVAAEKSTTTAAGKARPPIHPTPPAPGRSRARLCRRRSRSRSPRQGGSSPSVAGPLRTSGAGRAVARHAGRGAAPPTAVARWVGGTAGGAAFGSALNNCQLLLSTEILIIPSLAASSASQVRCPTHTDRRWLGGAPAASPAIPAELGPRER